MNLTEQTFAAVRAHAEAVYPHEACGLVVNSPAGQIYRPCTNRASTPSEHFRISAEDFAAAEDVGSVLAVVHSHPDAPATPSDADRVQCEASELPWVIVSVGAVDGRPECGGEVISIKPCGYVAPLVGRQFAHGVLDCYTLVRDFYARELGITLADYERVDDWWNQGGDLYSVERLNAEGFEEVSGELRRGDLIVMQVRAPVPNHAGVYLGDGQMIHHLYGRLSERVPYGGYWRNATRLQLRHRESRAEHG